MPELPDVEVYRRNLVSLVGGKRVRDAFVYVDKRTPSETALREAVVGATLADIVRDGKVLRFVFDNGNAMVVHLMLNGEFHIGLDIDALPAKRVSLIFEDGGYLSVADPSGIATVALNTPPSEVPDVLDDRFDLAALNRALKRWSAKPIKSILIDQQVVQGIGNKYSDEVLWLSGIAPQSSSGKVPEDAVARLYSNIKSLLRDATESVHANHPAAINGKMREGLKVHRQTATPSGNPVVEITVGGRSTYYSPDEQVVYE